jgi:hypothetical protein
VPPVNVSDCINRSEFTKKKTKERKERGDFLVCCFLINQYPEISLPHTDTNIPVSGDHVL